MASVGDHFLAGGGSPPDVSWSPYVWTGVVLAAASVYVIVRMRKRGSTRVFWAAVLAGLAVATIGTGVVGYQAVNVPFDDLGSFCSLPDPTPPSSIAADRVLQNCAAGKSITLARGDTVALALGATQGVDRWTQWTDFAVSNPDVVSAAGGAPYSLPGAPNSHFEYEVALFKADRPGRATISAVERGCAPEGCDRGIRWWVSIEVT